VAKAKPDGYTLLLVGNNLATLPSLFDLTYDPVTSLAPISLVLKGSMALVVNRDVKANTTAELIALAKSAPGIMNYGSSGLGSPQHLTMELFKSATGIDILHIPYKNAGDALIGILRGETAVMFMPVQSALPNLADGRIRALGLSSPVHHPLVSNVGTIADQIHVKNFDVDIWYGLFAPAGAPQQVVNVLKDEIAKFLTTPDVLDKLQSLTLVPAPSEPDELAHLLKSDVTRWSAIIRQAGLSKK
jgi:tripartite-type tricarboxylate transporter receptor subunit TctC